MQSSTCGQNCTDTFHAPTNFPTENPKFHYQPTKYHFYPNLQLGHVVVECIVGRVKSVSENYSVAFSVLNTNLLISAKIKSSEVFGSIQWDGVNASEVKLLYVPRHVKAVKGDTVITSGFNAVFPEGILIGVISKVEVNKKDSNYLSITVKLSTDFSKLTYVYLVENTQFQELDSLYRQSDLPNEY